MIKLARYKSLEKFGLKVIGLFSKRTTYYTFLNL